MDILYPTAIAADMVVVIPCYNEPELTETLDSLLACDRPNAKVLVAVVCNAGENAAEGGILQNRITYRQTLQRARSLTDPGGITLFPLLFEELPRKHAGVGLARKIGMDLAVHHFLHDS